MAQKVRDYLAIAAWGAPAGLAFRLFASYTTAVSLPQFWMRRARRLLPALFTMLAVVTVWACFFGEEHLAHGRSTKSYGEIADRAGCSERWVRATIRLAEREGPPQPGGVGAAGVARLRQAGRPGDGPRRHGARRAGNAPRSL